MPNPEYRPPVEKREQIDEKKFLSILKEVFVQLAPDEKSIGVPLNEAIENALAIHKIYNEAVEENENIDKEEYEKYHSALKEKIKEAEETFRDKYRDESEKYKRLKKDLPINQTVEKATSIIMEEIPELELADQALRVDIRNYLFNNIGRILHQPQGDLFKK